MRTLRAIFLFGAVVHCTLHAANLAADVIPPIGLAPGSEYQLIFVTADPTTATNSGIDSYNTFVQGEAALNPSLPSSSWDAVASTETANANSNAPNVLVGGSYLPVYNTHGVEVSGAAGLYSGDSLLGLADYTQYGAINFGASVWTGSTDLGDTAAGHALGDGQPEIGNTEYTSTSWIEYALYVSAFTSYMYALSGPITVPAPEPATITLLGSALSLLAGFQLLKRRRIAKQTA